ncbi:MAG: ABC transporter permease [Candidatus Bipolaricaulaceae bacterium]
MTEVVEIIESYSAVAGYTWQLTFSGLVGDVEGSTPLVARGVVPEDCMEDYACLIVSGRPISGDDAREVVLGQALADKLKVEPGQPVNIATATVAGSFNAATATVVGSLRYADAQVEERLAFVPLGFAQRLLRTDGVERVLLWLDDLDRAAAFSAQLSGELAAAKLPLAAWSWQQLNPSYGSLETFWQAFSGFAGIAVFIMVFFSVLEVLTIAFLERTREVGTVRALGTSRLRVFSELVLEGSAIGLLGGAMGVSLAAALAAGFNALGVTWLPPGAAMPQPIRVQLSLQMALVPLVTVLMATLVSSLYPAAKNARLSVAEALRTV